MPVIHGEKKNKKWSAEDDATLIRLNIDGKPYKEIAVLLGTSACSVRSHVCDLRSAGIFIQGRQKGRPQPNGRLVKTKQRRNMVVYQPEVKCEPVRGRKMNCMNPECQKVFISQGAHHRHCDRCRKREEPPFEATLGAGRNPNLIF